MNGSLPTVADNLPNFNQSIEPQVKQYIEKSEQIDENLKISNFFLHFFLSLPIADLIKSGARYVMYSHLNKKIEKVDLSNLEHENPIEWSSTKFEVKEKIEKPLKETKQQLISSAIRVGIIALCSLVVVGIVIGAIAISMGVHPVAGVFAGFVGIFALTGGLYFLDPKSCQNFIDFLFTGLMYRIAVFHPGSNLLYTSNLVVTILTRLAFYLGEHVPKKDLPDGGLLASVLKKISNRESIVDRLAKKCVSS